MRGLMNCLMLAGALCLSACETASPAQSSGDTVPSGIYVVNSGAIKTENFDDYKVTPAEAKTHACPQSVLEVGASPDDCQCAEDKLFELGQDGKALADLEAGMRELSGDALLTGIQTPRVTAIEIIRIDAFDACGFFEDGHVVGQGL